MASSASSGAPSSGGNKKQLSIHKVRELQLDMVDIGANYEVLKEIGSGDYGKVILAVHRISNYEVILLHSNVPFTHSTSLPGGAQSRAKGDHNFERFSD